tara:strand:- start:2923 stop:3135 length:213 start_codon:yes stop_codon:yes gene_type:complete
MARKPFERKLDGHICSDPKISLFVRLKTLVAAASFWLLFLSCRRKSNWLERIRDKTIMDDGAKRALALSL